MTSPESVRASMQGNVAQPSKSHMSKTNNKLVSEWKCCTCNCAVMFCWQTDLVVREQNLASLTLSVPASAPLQGEVWAGWTANRMKQSRGPTLHQSYHW